MAKAQAVKPKSFFGGLFGGFGAPKAKPARPASNASSTMTNLPAGGTAAKREPKAAARAAESPATPADWRPIGLVFSSVNMSANVRCAEYDAL